MFPSAWRCREDLITYLPVLHKTAQTNLTPCSFAAAGLFQHTRMFTTMFRTVTAAFYCWGDGCAPPARLCLERAAADSSWVSPDASYPRLKKRSATMILPVRSAFTSGRLREYLKTLSEIEPTERPYTCLIQAIPYSCVR